jgi:hypothetical protein
MERESSIVLAAEFLSDDFLYNDLTQKKAQILMLLMHHHARIQGFLVGYDVDEEKIGRDLGTAVGPQRDSEAEPQVGVQGAKSPMKVTLFFTKYTVILHFLNSVVR